MVFIIDLLFRRLARQRLYVEAFMDFLSQHWIFLVPITVMVLDSSCVFQLFSSYLSYIVQPSSVCQHSKVLDSFPISLKYHSMFKVIRICFNHGCNVKEGKWFSITQQHIAAFGLQIQFLYLGHRYCLFLWEASPPILILKIIFLINSPH